MSLTLSCEAVKFLVFARVCYVDPLAQNPLYIINNLLILQTSSSTNRLISLHLKYNHLSFHLIIAQCWLQMYYADVVELIAIHDPAMSPP